MEALQQEVETPQKQCPKSQRATGTCPTGFGFPGKSVHRQGARVLFFRKEQTGGTLLARKTTNSPERRMSWLSPRRGWSKNSGMLRERHRMNKRHCLRSFRQRQIFFVRVDSKKASGRGGRLISRDLFEMAQQAEKQNLQTMKDLQQRLESAEKSLVPYRETSRINRLSEALNRTEDLVAGLESLSRRILEMQQASPGRRQQPHRSHMNKGEKTPETLSYSGQGQSKPREPAEELSMSQSPADGKSSPTVPSQSQGENSVNRNGQPGEQHEAERA